MNISLPDEMRAWVEAEVQGGGFSSTSEYFRQLVREAKARKAEQEARQDAQGKKAELTALLVEGIESGPAQPISASWWAELLEEVDGELQKRGVKDRLSALDGERA